MLLFRDFLIDITGSEERRFWTPRQSKAFRDYLKKKELRKGKFGYSDHTINRINAHLKTFAKWLHKLEEHKKWGAPSNHLFESTFLKSRDGLRAKKYTPVFYVPQDRCAYKCRKTMQFAMIRAKSEVDF
ncbi:MAG: hypothetical protein KJP23_18205 [Deltaproteobacteria bacterium]|nr:hypothetical protein [Deltaproteobacteria bacterium]